MFVFRSLGGAIGVDERIAQRFAQAVDVLKLLTLSIRESGKGRSRS
ncbi:MAG: hypothetical protein R3C40_11280 [Parvularculaceae bacterium]